MKFGKTRWETQAFEMAKRCFQISKCELFYFMGGFLWCFFKLSTTFEAKKSENVVPVVRRWLGVHLYVSARRAWSSNSAKVQKAGQSWLESARDGITPFGKGRVCYGKPSFFRYFVAAIANYVSLLEAIYKKSVGNPWFWLVSQGWPARPWNHQPAGWIWATSL